MNMNALNGLINGVVLSVFKIISITKNIIMAKWKGLCNYLLPTPPHWQYELSLDEGTKTYWWYKSGTEKKDGYKSWTRVKIAVWCHKLFGWYL